MTYQIYNDGKLNKSEVNRFFVDLVLAMPGHWRLKEEGNTKYLSFAQYDYKLLIKRHPNKQDIKDPQLKIAIGGRMKHAHKRLYIWQILNQKDCAKSMTFNINDGIEPIIKAITQIDNPLLISYLKGYEMAYQAYLFKLRTTSLTRLLLCEIFAIISEACFQCCSENLYDIAWYYYAAWTWLYAPWHKR